MDSLLRGLGRLIPVGAPLVIVADELEGVDEAVTRLARVGIESVKGFLSGGMYAWDQAGLESAATPQMPLDELRQRIEEKDGLQIVDVRGPGEYAAGHAPVRSISRCLISRAIFQNSTATNRPR